VVVDCRCPKAATHWPWVAGVADPKNPMVGRFAGCCASAVATPLGMPGDCCAAGFQSGLCPLRVKLGGKGRSATRLVVPNEQALAGVGGSSFSATRDIL
jgi:hypothetical protein